MEKAAAEIESEFFVVSTSHKNVLRIGDFQSKEGVYGFNSVEAAIGVITQIGQVDFWVNYLETIHPALIVEPSYLGHQ